MLAVFPWECDSPSLSFSSPSVKWGLSHKIVMSHLFINTCKAQRRKPTTCQLFSLRGSVFSV